MFSPTTKGEYVKRSLLIGAALSLALMLTGSMTAEGATVLPLKKASDFTSLFERKNDWTWSGGDQMTSLKTPSGSIYWSTGDNMRGTQNSETGAYNSGAYMVSNSLLLQEGSSLVPAAFDNSRDPETGHFMPIVPDPATATPQNQHRYWTQGMFWANGSLYVMCQQVKATSEGLGFDLTGVVFAKFHEIYNGKLKPVSMIVTPSTGVNVGKTAAGAQYAADAVVQGGYIYLYGYSHTEDQYIPSFSYVARVPFSRVETPAAWTYWDGAIWNTKMSAAKPIIGSQISSVRFINGMWVVAHKPWNGYGDTVKIETSVNPYGPWTTKASFMSPAGQTPRGKNYITYGPMLHPEFSLTSGKLLVSVDRNGVSFWDDLLQDADLYKPVFTEVDIS